jgi:hypothetical protein
MHVRQSGLQDGGEWFAGTGAVGQRAGDVEQVLLTWDGS